MSNDKQVKLSDLSVKTGIRGGAVALKSVALKTADLSALKSVALKSVDFGALKTVALKSVDFGALKTVALKVAF